MSYRDDLDAAHARIADQERQLALLESRQGPLAPRRRGGVGAVIAVLAGLGLALGAVLGHLGMLVAVGGVLVALIAAAGLQPATPIDRGPYPVRREVAATCADGDVRLLVITLVSLRDRPAVALPTFTSANRDRIAQISGDAIEGVLRDVVATRPLNELRGDRALAEAVRVGASATLDGYGLAIDTLHLSLLR